MVRIYERLQEHGEHLFYIIEVEVLIAKSFDVKDPDVAVYIDWHV